MLLLGTEAAAEASPAIRCLPGQDGFISMRLRGSIEEDLDWAEPELKCTGMSRPDGKGLRLRFAGTRAGGDFVVIFAASGLGIGASARAVPVNVTVLDGAGERIYGTQGDSRCILDGVEQIPVAHPALPARSFRVSARGFCVGPARAVDGEGSLLLTRFDFAGLVVWREDADAPEPGPTDAP